MERELTNPWDTVAKNMCFENEREMLESLYETNSISKVSRILNCGTATVSRRLEMYGFAKRPRGGAHIKTNTRYLLFHIDQRMLMGLTLTKLANKLKINSSSIYKYRRYKKEGKI